MSQPLLIHRRDWLATAGAITCSALATSPAFAAAPKKRPRVAAIYTELRFRSHAYNILENFFLPYMFCGELVDPGCEVVSLYADQFPQDDMTREASKRLNVPLFKTIDEALCVGGKSLDVDAVLLIGEHGDYPYNALGQHLYPRKQFFDQIVRTMQRSGRFVPLFNDKHLSYRWDWAKEMYDVARENKMPMQAGSSVPLGERRPNWELPAGAEVEEVVSIHGGGMEVYDFHALELLESIVEGRQGGETGVASVETFTEDKLKKAMEEGIWSQPLFSAAMQAERDIGVTRQQRPPLSIRPGVVPPDKSLKVSHAVRVTYRDGMKATILKVGGDSARWNFACRLKGDSQPHATAIYNGPWGNRCLFKALSHAIQHMFVTGQEPYPLERTLLTTGITEAIMKAHAAGKLLETPHLGIAYQAADFRAFRENGASWKLITPETKQPETFDPGDEKLLGKNK